PLLGGDMQVAISEWLAITMLAFYFPIKEICIRRGDRFPQKPLLMSLGFIALFIAFRNFWYYKRGLAEAEFLWEIATGRVVMNEHVLLMAALVALTFLLYSRKKLPTVGLLGVFAVLAAGVVIGQSRAVWISFLLGAAVIFFCVDRRKKVQILLLGLLGLAAIIGTGALLFDDFFTVIVAGLADRFFSLQTAVTEDLSLINRFIEMGAAWEHIRLNPIVGHGFGVPIKYYSLVYEWTHEASFIHNGPVGVWYRHGLIGLVLLSVFYIGSILAAFRLVRGEAVTRFDRTLAIAVLAAFAAESLVGNTENPFATSDKTLFIAALAGFVAASWHRARQADADAS
ncbi:MAG: O-antigen ligase family protein, partial [Rhodothermales bacterium]